VQILDGLEEGEVVAMSPPAGFQEEIAEDNAQDGPPAEVNG